MKQFGVIILSLLFLKAQAQTAGLSVADSLYAEGNYTKAINEYSKIGTASAALQIARSYNAIGNFDKAVTQYQFVTTQHPDIQLAQFEFVKLLLKMGNVSDANAVFSNLAELNTDNQEYQYYLGETNKELDQLEEALVHYKKAVALDSTHLRSLFQLAKYYTVKQERDNALEYIEKGLWFYDTDVALINLKALVLFNDYQYNNAIPWFEKLLDLGEDKDYIYEKLADCYSHNWEFEKSKETYGILLDRDDTNSQTYFSLANVYIKEQKLDSAKVFINKAMEVQKPIFAQGYNSLADIARQQKDLKTALSFYQMAHQEDATDARIYYNICTVYDQLGDNLQKKLEYYQNFLKQYPNEHPYFYESVRKRIRELKEQIHFAKD
ncbi:MAG: tetratricopeptide repeat protein [Maribacter sp.]